jgi:hypothetical protein
MFEGVPERLTAAVRDARNDFKDDSIYVMAAGLVMVEYLRKQIDDPDKPHDFLQNRKNQDGGLDWKYTVRTTSVGETLFLLRNCVGFVDICRRLKERDLRSAFYEMFAARLFHRAGYQIVAKPEVGKKGEDFDFTARKNGEVINVEVTALIAPKFSNVTVGNALRGKASQLPTTSPAIIVCAYPEQWHDPKIPPSVLFQEAVVRFFRSSRRVNAVVLVHEVHQQAGLDDYGGLFFGKQVFFNPSPRMTINSMQFLVSDPPMSDVSGTEILNQADMKRRVGYFRDSEFYRWVDFAIST